MRKFIRWISLVFGCLAMLACTTLEPVSKRQVQPGDVVQVNKTNGQTLKFTVERVDAQGLHAPGLHVPYREIASVHREEPSLWRSALVGLGAIAGVALIAVVAGTSGGGKSGGW